MDRKHDSDCEPVHLLSVITVFSGIVIYTVIYWKPTSPCLRVLLFLTVVSMVAPRFPALRSFLRPCLFEGFEEEPFGSVTKSRLSDVPFFNAYIDWELSVSCSIQVPRGWVKKYPTALASISKTRRYVVALDGTLGLR